LLPDAEEVSDETLAELRGLALHQLRDPLARIHRDRERGGEQVVLRPEEPVHERRIDTGFRSDGAD
jgi:hypothetical protein